MREIDYANGNEFQLFPPRLPDNNTVFTVGLLSLYTSKWELMRRESEAYYIQEPLVTIKMKGCEDKDVDCAVYVVLCLYIRYTE